MTRAELLQRLEVLRTQAVRALEFLSVEPKNPAAEAQARQLLIWLKKELEQEFNRISPERTQKGMTIFEVSVYAPTIADAWTQSGIRRLKLDEAPTARWAEAVEAVIYTASKYIR